MSLLWIQAAWHNAQPGTEEWDEHGFGHETREQRRDRYIQRVQDAHGVDRLTALDAIKAVAQHHRAPVRPFTSAPERAFGKRLPEEVDFKSAWDAAPVKDIDLRTPIHASQHFLHQRYLAHNLFHPGEIPADSEGHAGHPDAESITDPEDENYEWHTDASENGPRDLPRLIRQTDGSHVVIDGHHRMATELLLGKPTTPARVLDVRHLSGRLAPP